MKSCATWLGSARNQSVFTGKKTAAAGSTRLRPIHFINRGNHTAVKSTSRPHYKYVICWQDKYLMTAAIVITPWRVSLVVGCGRRVVNHL